MIYGIDPVDLMVFLFIGMLIVIFCLVWVMMLMYRSLKGIHNETSLTRQNSGELRAINDRLFRISLDLNHTSRTDETVQIPEYIIRAGQQLYGISAKRSTYLERADDTLGDVTPVQRVKSQPTNIPASGDFQSREYTTYGI